jgi:hypothetical protein
MKSNRLKASATAVLLSLIGFGAQAAGVTLTISCGTVGQDFDFCKKAADEWSAKTGNTVKHLQFHNPRRIFWGYSVRCSRPNPPTSTY